MTQLMPGIASLVVCGAPVNQVGFEAVCVGGQDFGHEKLRLLDRVFGGCGTDVIIGRFPGSNPGWVVIGNTRSVVPYDSRHNRGAYLAVAMIVRPGASFDECEAAVRDLDIYSEEVFSKLIGSNGSISAGERLSTLALPPFSPTQAPVSTALLADILAQYVEFGRLADAHTGSSSAQPMSISELARCGRMDRARMHTASDSRVAMESVNKKHEALLAMAKELSASCERIANARAVAEQQARVLEDARSSFVDVGRELERLGTRIEEGIRTHAWHAPLAGSNGGRGPVAPQPSQRQPSAGAPVAFERRDVPVPRPAYSKARARPRARPVPPEEDRFSLFSGLAYIVGGAIVVVAVVFLAVSILVGRDAPDGAEAPSGRIDQGSVGTKPPPPEETEDQRATEQESIIERRRRLEAEDPVP
jgi:VIT1/CCC1 family predicted Fe2+/Mn2+ transporter